MENCRSLTRISQLWREWLSLANDISFFLFFFRPRFFCNLREYALAAKVVNLSRIGFLPIQLSFHLSSHLTMYIAQLQTPSVFYLRLCPSVCLSLSVSLSASLSACLSLCLSFSCLVRCQYFLSLPLFTTFPPSLSHMLAYTRALVSICPNPSPGSNSSFARTTS